jgi:hypothetical protein
MRTSDVDILLVPGWIGSDPDHWQSRWARSLRTARIIEQEDWSRPNRDAWVSRIIEAVRQATRPVVFVAHSWGVAAVVHAAPKLAELGVAGAYLVAPADVDVTDNIFPATDSGFSPVPLEKLPFPAVLVASSDDPHCSFDRAREFAERWGAAFVPAGNAGHINSESGHGPWPEGLMRFGLFLSQLNTRA